MNEIEDLKQKACVFFGLRGNKLKCMTVLFDPLEIHPYYANNYNVLQFRALSIAKETHL